MIEFWASRVLWATLEGIVWVLLAWPVCRLLLSRRPDIAAWIWRIVLIKMLLLTAGVGMPVLKISGGSGQAATPWWAWLVLGGSILGGACVCANLLGEFLSLRRVAKSPSSFDRDIYQLLRSCAAELGITRMPRIVQGDFSPRPAVWGTFRPILVLSPDFKEKFSATEQRLIVLHELAHCRRRDLAWGLLPCLTQILFFFNPIHGLAVRELMLCQEAACDRDVLQTKDCRRSEYANVLVKAAFGHGAVTTLSAPMSLHGWMIAKRMTVMLKARKKPMGWLAVALLPFMAGLFFGGVAQVHAQAEPESESGLALFAEVGLSR